MDRKDVYEYLQVDNLHNIAIYRKGNINGEKVIYCHGGPGGCIKEHCFSFFDLFKFDVIAFDQRGCGNSEPFAELKENNIYNLVEDIEKIRIHFNLGKVYLYGGSFGTTLALCYAIKYPNNVKGLVLRGVFLGRKKDIDWLYQCGAGYFFPESFDRYSSFIKGEKRSNLLKAYDDIFNSGDSYLIYEACKHWACWERSVIKLFPEKINFAEEVTKEDISLARLECHYFINKLWFDDDDYILNNIDKLKEHKVIIVHGRYDVDCVPAGAYDLYKRLDNCDLRYVIGGHGANDLDYNGALIKACEDIIDNGRFYKIEVNNSLFDKINNEIESKNKYSYGDTLIIKNSDTFEYKRLKIKEIFFHDDIYKYTAKEKI